MKYDLLLKGGTLIDPAQGLHTGRDVAFAEGVVAAVGENLPSAEARQTLDATGRIVAPGLIDLHVHVFWGVSHFGIEPDPTCLARGATTVVDAGSAGAGQGPGNCSSPSPLMPARTGYYVLDAGNARIAVFGANRRYLTQWGHRGSDENGFDFGKGVPDRVALTRDFERIQKFAP